LKHTALDRLQVRLNVILFYSKFTLRSKLVIQLLFPISVNLASKILCHPVLEF